MSPVAVMNVSHRKREPNDFHQVIEGGFGCQIYLFVHFIFPVVVIFDGVEYLTDDSACIIYTPRVTGKNIDITMVFLLMIS